MKQLGLTCAMALLGFCFLFSTNAHAQFKGSDGKRREHMEFQVQKIYDQLGLTAEQKEQLEENKSKHKASREALTTQLKQTMQTLGEELKKPALDEPKLNATHSQFKDLRNRLADERFDAILEVRKILTPQQFAKFIELLDEKHGKSHAEEMK